MKLLRQILNDKFAAYAFIILAVLYIIILFADFIAPYSSTYSNRDLSYAPPSVIYTIDENDEEVLVAENNDLDFEYAKYANLRNKRDKEEGCSM